MKQQKYWWLIDHIDAEKQRSESIKQGLLAFLRKHQKSLIPITPKNDRS
jgi:hypothetical protein